MLARKHVASLRSICSLREFSLIRFQTTNVERPREIGNIRSRLLSALKDCRRTREFCKGRSLHALAVETGEDVNIYVASALIDMYAKCGSLNRAYLLFSQMHRVDVVLWNTILLGCIDNEEDELAVRLFSDMQGELSGGNSLSFIAALKACMNMAAREEGTEVDGRVLKLKSLENGVAVHSAVMRADSNPDSRVRNTIMSMYIKCGSLSDALAVFNGMKNPGVVSWNILILGYVEHGQPEVAVELYSRMQREGFQPSDRTLVAALKAYTSLAAREESGRLGYLEKGMEVHSQTKCIGCESEIILANALVNVYGKCGSMFDSRRVFDRMSRHDVVSWTALILGYAENGNGSMALELFSSMGGCSPDVLTFMAALQACVNVAEREQGSLVDGKRVKLGALEKVMFVHSRAARDSCDSDIKFSNLLVDSYAKCGSLVDARMIFDRLLRPTVVSWTALMLGYAQSGEPKLALELLGYMQTHGCSPDSATFAAALKACTSLASSVTARALHSDICRAGLESDELLSNCLVDVYGKCGCTAESEHVFGLHHTRDSVGWNALISGYSRQGDSRYVLELFNQMQEEGSEVTDITLLCVLTACSHAGLTVTGKKYFDEMKPKYGVPPSIEHYHCMVDMFGRANQAEASVNLVNSMPYKPTPVTWRTVLGSCCKWKNVPVGRLAFEALVSLAETDSSSYLMMASIYESVGLPEERAEVEDRRRRACAISTLELTETRNVVRAPQLRVRYRERPTVGEDRNNRSMRGGIGETEEG